MLQILGIFLTVSGIAGFAGLFFLKRVSGGRLGVLTSIVTGGLAALGIYLLIGSPGLPDQPIKDRVDELAARDPASLSMSEQLAYQERRKLEEPENPAPHFIIGEIMQAQGRPEDAIRAYQSALRRDQNYLPALQRLADTLTVLAEGAVIGTQARIYQQIYAIRPDNLRAGFMIGLGLFQQGDEESAKAQWRAVMDSIPEGDTRRDMVLGWMSIALEEAGAQTE